MTDHSDILLDASWITSRCVDFFSSPLSVVVLDSVNSTNDYLLSHDTHLPTVCLAEQQTAARARTGGRIWYAPPYQNITMSVSVSISRSLDQLSALSLVVALSVVAALSSLGMADAKVKWPNDVWYQQKKIAGILIDVKQHSETTTEVVIGIGLNVNMRQQPGVITQAWTSLANIQNKSFNRNQVVLALLKQLSMDLLCYEAQGFAALLPRWRVVDVLYNQEVVLQVSSNQKVQGRVMGVSERGFLLLQTPAGDIVEQASGDIIRQY